MRDKPTSDDKYDDYRRKLSSWNGSVCPMEVVESNYTRYLRDVGEMGQCLTYYYFILTTVTIGTGCVNSIVG